MVTILPVWDSFLPFLTKQDTTKDLVLSLGGIGAILGVLAQKDWDLISLQIMSMMNFVKFVHGFFSMPFFLLLVVPLLRNIFLHTWPTGYDRQGRCRRYIGPQPPTPKETGQLLLPCAHHPKSLELLGLPSRNQCVMMQNSPASSVSALFSLGLVLPPPRGTSELPLVTEPSSRGTGPPWAFTRHSKNTQCL